MDAIKINRGNKIYGFLPADIHSMMEVDEKLLIVFNDNFSHKISDGEPLYFRRVIYGENEKVDTIVDEVRIYNKTTYTENGITYDAVYTTIPERKRLQIGQGRYYNISIRREERPEMYVGDAFFDENGRLYVMNDDGLVSDESIFYHSGNTDTNVPEKMEECFTIVFSEPHNVFQQDISYVETELQDEDGYTFAVLNGNGDQIGELCGVSIPFTGLPMTTVTSADTLTLTTYETCGKFNEDRHPYYLDVYKYTHTPEKFSLNAIKVTSANTQGVDGGFFEKMCYLIENGVYYVPEYNPYYYTRMEEIKMKKTCNFWVDGWWAAFNAKNDYNSWGDRSVYYNSGHTRAEIGRYAGYWSVPMVTFSEDDQHGGVLSDDAIGSYIDEIVNSSIPDVIDFEKMKYTPTISGDTFMPVTSLTFDFHFRKRDMIDEREINEKRASGFDLNFTPYKDGWNINEESASTMWWNGMEYYGTSASSAAILNFIEQSGETSDMIGFLNFSDSDIMYRKSRVARTFVRLSFYTSNDPITQKLLYYSTIFLDENRLYGKFMKQFLLRNKKLGKNEINVPIVFFDDNSSSARLDTEIVVVNEYNDTTSSEGFNLYLFKDDALKTDEGKDDRTIYMKVEFNHAGNGKTIPMLMWPKDENGNYTELTTANFLSCLYIPVGIRYIDNRYIYYIPSAKNEDENIRLILFEPKLGR